MFRNLLVGLIVVSASTASAGVMGISSVNRTFAAPDSALTGHIGLFLSVMTDDGSAISAVDVNITGQLHQRWGFEPDAEVLLPTPNSLNTTNGDSHLMPVVGALVGSELREDNNLSGSPLTSTATRRYGYGSFLRGAWGIPGASQTNKANLAYIVIPEASVPSLQVNGQVATTNGTFSFTKAIFADQPPLPAILTSNPVVGPGVELEFQFPNPAPLPIALSNTGVGVININSITLAGPHASQFAFVGTLPTTLTGFLPAQQFGVKPIYPLPGGTGDLMAVVQVRTDWGNLDFDVLLKVPEPSTLLISACAALPFTRRIRLSTPARKAYR